MFLLNQEMMKDQAKVFNTIYLYTTTAFPGFHKLLLLVLIKYFFITTDLSEFINDAFIIYILGYLTIFNWSNFILTDMPKLSAKKQPLFFGKIILGSLPFLLFSALILVLLKQFSIVVNLYAALSYLVLWSFYQLWRYYFIALKLYKTLFYSDIIYTLLTLVALYISFAYEFNIMLMQGLVSIAVPIGVLLIKTNQPAYFFELSHLLKFDPKFYVKSLTYSVINLSTGGIQLFFAPLSYQLLDSQSTSIVGLSSNIATVFLLIPRTFAYRYISLFVTSYRNNREALKIQFKKFVKEIYLFIFITLAGVILIGIGYTAFFEKQSNYFLLLFVIIIANQLISQLALPASNLLVVVNESKYLLKINLINFMVYSVGFTLIYTSINDGLLILSLSIMVQMVTNVVRSISLNRICMKKIV